MLSILTTISAAITLAMIGVMAGIFFTFSNSVMRGLDAIDPGHAIRAMQSVNRKILNPVFLATFTLPPIFAATTGGLLLWVGETWAAAIFFLAAATYVLGAIVPTAAVNVPLNTTLDAATVPTGTTEAARLWSDYSTRWTRWNTLRALISTISLLIVGLAIFAWGRQW